MATDTSIHRSSPSDAAVAMSRKQQNTQGMDLSRQSFLEDLLTLGQFEFTNPQPTSPPAAYPADKSSELESDSDKKGDSESKSEPTQPVETASASQAQAAFAAQAIAPQIQLATPQAKTESSTEDKVERVETKGIPQRTGDEPADTTKSASTPTAIAAKAEQTDASGQEATTPLPVESAAPITDDSAAAQSDVPLTDGDSPLAVGEDKPNHAVQESRATPDSADKREDQAEQERDNTELDLPQTETKPKTGISLNEFDSVQESDPAPSDADATEGLPQPARSKRSERLAERATDGGSKTDSRETSLEPTLGHQATKDPTPIEADFIASASSESSLTASTPVSAATPSVIAQPIAVGSPAATSLSNASESRVVGVNATRAGSGATSGVSNTTISAGIANPGRPDSGRSEAARGNSGTQITAYQEGKLVQRVMRGIEQLANGGGQVRLRLHPPELGALQMSLRMEGGQMFAKLEVENTLARDALLNNVQSLKDRMAEQGMKVAAFEVEVSADSAGSGLGSSSSQADGSRGNPSRWENTSSRFAQQNSNRLPTEPTPTERKPNAAWTRTNGSLDLTV